MPRHAHTPRHARARYFILSFALQYPKATTKVWLQATLLQWCLVNFLLAPLKVGFFAVALPRLIRGKLWRLRLPARAAGAFPFRAPMRDSAAEDLAARHAHLPIAKFLLGHDAGAPGEQAPTPPHPSAAPRPVPSPAELDELLRLGAAPRGGGGDHGAQRTAAISGRDRARLGEQLCACGKTLPLVALSLVLFMPETLQGVTVEGGIAVLVGLGMVAALECTRIAKWVAAACVELVRTHGAAAVAAPIAVIVFAGMAVLARRAAFARRAHHHAELMARFGDAFDAELLGRAAGGGCWPASRDRAGDADADAAQFSSIGQPDTPSHSRTVCSSRIVPV